MSLIEHLRWRYATKKFNPTKKVGAGELEILKEAIRLAATSYGLQPFKVAVIDDALLKAELRKAAYNQSQISDCSHLFVFSHFTALNPQFIDDYIQLCAEKREQDHDLLKGYGNFMKTTLGNFNEQELHNWSSKQAYIGMTNLLMACAELRIDACPIEGFEAEKFNEILDLNPMDLSACVIVSIGYRASDDPDQFMKKVRLPKSDLFI
ncbi:NAD(P)H-dependent oxidoreductase [Putridiphycobacter roseus]|uniref:NAD(P)H-dependent oxidoreductase n=1 Tax=Putridiphycobacter roseus TaxID=2219161 RepID=A0A2W1N4L6_9FLAO|nr:NAD(P)H-dependent oxidoreductase [Putridiphycobacter roseus]PZE18011.1 NAD(P)H-dependent oxidoreductase [Putridiphycobacter roseus]